MLVRLRYPGIAFAFSITESIPPAVTVPNPKITIRAIVITILCIKSEVLAARNPPSVV